MPVLDRIRKFFMRSTSVLEPSESDRRAVVAETPEAPDEQASAEEKPAETAG
jgi:hypothetical protein